MTRWPPVSRTPSFSKSEAEPSISFSFWTLSSRVCNVALPTAKSSACIPNSTDKAASLVVIPETKGHISERITENPFCCTVGIQNHICILYPYTSERERPPKWFALRETKIYQVIKIPVYLNLKIRWTLSSLKCFCFKGSNILRQTRLRANLYLDKKQKKT